MSLANTSVELYNIIVKRINAFKVFRLLRCDDVSDVLRLALLYGTRIINAYAH